MVLFRIILFLRGVFNRQLRVGRFRTTFCWLKSLFKFLSCYASLEDAIELLVVDVNWWHVKVNKILSRIPGALRFKPALGLFSSLLQWGTSTGDGIWTSVLP